MDSVTDWTWQSGQCLTRHGKVDSVRLDMAKWTVLQTRHGKVDSVRLDMAKWTVLQTRHGKVDSVTTYALSLEGNKAK